MGVNACDVCEIVEICNKICAENKTELPEDLLIFAACEYECASEYEEAIDGRTNELEDHIAER